MWQGDFPRWMHIAAGDTYSDSGGVTRWERFKSRWKLFLGQYGYGIWF